MTMIFMQYYQLQNQISRFKINIESSSMSITEFDYQYSWFSASIFITITGFVNEILIIEQCHAVDNCQHRNRKTAPLRNIELINFH